MKINIISNKLIKPQTPTPQTLKNYKISCLDYCVGPMNFSIILFYQSNSNPKNNNKLQESLAKTLVQFYPLAGRYIESDHAVDCSDQGVEFIEAEAPDVKLLDLLENVETKQLHALLPEQYFRLGDSAPILSIQSTLFRCGGRSIAAGISHRIFDAASLATFITAWSNAAADLGKLTPTPSFDLPKLIPYKDCKLKFSVEQYSMNKILIKKFSFDKDFLTNLRSKLRRNSYEKSVTRVCVVSAVISKALIKLDRWRHGFSRDFLLTQPVNMRERTIPPQPRHACGNLAMPSLTRRLPAAEVEGVGLPELVELIGESVKRNIAEYEGIVSPYEDGCDVIINSFEKLVEEWSLETNFVVVSDWSKFGFHEADFGWGRPVWTSIGPEHHCISTAVFLSDREGGGIEAWVQLKEDEMVWFEEIINEIKHNEGLV